MKGTFVMSYSQTEFDISDIWAKKGYVCPGYFDLFVTLILKSSYGMIRAPDSF